MPWEQKSVQAPGQGRVGEGDRPASRFVVLWRLKIGEWARRGRDWWSSVALRSRVLVLASRIPVRCCLV
jgi:hypothetical protein